MYNRTKPGKSESVERFNDRQRRENWTSHEVKKKSRVLARIKTISEQSHARISRCKQRQKKNNQFLQGRWKITPTGPQSEKWSARILAESTVDTS